MIIPVRCFSCGTVIADKYEEYVERVKKGEAPEKVMNDLGIKRYCCRRMVFSHVDFIEELMKYKT
ncbi:MAG: DNA-directed RNA polymerase subunit N [Candidatus Diapherotrites archaeon CG11_big_fil_rev_8_21_14_0_20_37_9]|nr:MAG: DNA-directed RNA polymerase subunit N [Candidatus Diapherotrites archaeon CG11_big_fil_rev_8_21_14_0_20_37_9]